MAETIAAPASAGGAGRHGTPIFSSDVWVPVTGLYAEMPDRRHLPSPRAEDRPVRRRLFVPVGGWRTLRRRLRRLLEPHDSTRQQPRLAGRDGDSGLCQASIGVGEPRAAARLLQLQSRLVVDGLDGARQAEAPGAAGCEIVEQAAAGRRRRVNLHAAHDQVVRARRLGGIERHPDAAVHVQPGGRRPAVAQPHVQPAAGVALHLAANAEPAPEAVEPVAKRFLPARSRTGGGRDRPAVPPRCGSSAGRPARGCALAGRPRP